MTDRQWEILGELDRRSGLDRVRGDGREGGVSLVIAVLVGCVIALAR